MKSRDLFLTGTSIPEGQCYDRNVDVTDKCAALRARKTEGPPIAALTAWDYPTARLLDESGVDLILVGDSLGMVVLGFPDTTHVTIDHMTHHVAAAARGCRKALLVGDLPIHSYDDDLAAIRNARILIEAGAEAVKLEGGAEQAGKVRALTAEGIPVVGHVGMLPQRVKEEGGYRRKGRSADELSALIEGASALEDAGCFALVLESVVQESARQVTHKTMVPTIGIGCGIGNCDGEIAVTSDIIGSYPWFVPPFAISRADVAGEIRKSVTAYVAACHNSTPS